MRSVQDLSDDELDEVFFDAEALLLLADFEADFEVDFDADFEAVFFAAFFVVFFATLCFGGALSILRSASSNGMRDSDAASLSGLPFGEGICDVMYLRTRPAASTLATR